MLATSDMSISPTRSLCSSTHVSAMVTSICDAALASALSETRSNLQVLGWEHLSRCPEFYQNFKYSLARNVAKLLGTHDKYVQRVYLLEPFNNPNRETNQRKSLETILYLVVLVDKRSVALEAFIEALDQSLVRHLHKLLSPSSADSQALLDMVIVIEDARKRKGYSYLVDSFALPIKLWERSV